MAETSPAAKQQLDSLFREAIDVQIIVGVCYIAGHKTAITRVVSPDPAPLRDWPETLTFRRMWEASSPVEMFVVFEVPHILTPFAAIEWHDSFEEFIETATRTGMFLCEYYNPTTLYRALIRGGRVEAIPPTEITPDVFADILNGAFEGTPKVNVMPPKGAI